LDRKHQFFRGAALKKNDTKSQGNFITVLTQILTRKNVNPKVIKKLKVSNHPQPKTIEQFAAKYNFSYDERVSLYRARGNNIPGYPEVTERERESTLALLKSTLEHSLVPIAVVDYNYRIWWVNNATAHLILPKNSKLPNLREVEISLFQVAFDDDLFSIRSKIKTSEEWRSIALSLVRDFMAFNVLRQHEPFYKKYPMCFGELDDFMTIWNEAQENIDYAQDWGIVYMPMIVPHDLEKELKFTLTATPLPYLNNELRLVRAIPLDKETEVYFQSMGQPVIVFSA
jgi:hypothetical protein